MLPRTKANVKVFECQHVFDHELNSEKGNM